MPQRPAQVPGAVGEQGGQEPDHAQEPDLPGELPQVRHQDRQGVISSVATSADWLSDTGQEDLDIGARISAACLPGHL
jgi:hypothetical protein